MYKCYIENQYVKENKFLKEKYINEELPDFNQSIEFLPKPIWEGHENVIECYYKAWQIAFGNLRKPREGDGFIANYIDTALNGHLFMWDSVFILMFGKYGNRAFKFQQTLDNFYGKQHPDGFICREFDEADGADYFERFDPVSTGPNILAWSEWTYYKNFKDKVRLEKVFPVLLAYHQWLKKYRTWQNGSYWSSGWGCGMDNQPRVKGSPEVVHYDHAHISWCDATMQQFFSGNLLINIANILGREEEVKELKEEVSELKEYVNSEMWDEETKFYYDIDRKGQQIKVKSIGAFWSIISGLASEERLKQLVDHLQNKEEFNTNHRIPTLSKDDPDYDPEGCYWKGGVWAPTNYMVIKGLEARGYADLAHEIALNHLNNVVNIFEDTGTLWENYSPEYMRKGSISAPNFVGWTGLAPIAVLFENIFGIRAETESQRIIWDIRLCEEHGVKNYCYGDKGLINFHCLSRKSINDKPKVSIESNTTIEVEIRWHNGLEIMKVQGTQYN